LVLSGAGSGSKSEAARDVQEALRNYLSVTGQIDDTLRQKAAQAYKTYVDTLQRAASETDYSKQLENSYRTYMKALAEATSQAQKDAIDTTVSGLRAYQALQDEARNLASA
jgi:GTP cyclohydrolase III